jgi:hypothetical protein
VKEIVYEVNSGTAAYVLVSKGGFLGVGGTQYAVPFSAVTIGPDNDLFIDMSKSQLETAPKLSEDPVADLNDRPYVAKVHEFFGSQPAPFDTDRSLVWQNHRGDDPTGDR